MAVDRARLDDPRRDLATAGGRVVVTRIVETLADHVAQTRARFLAASRDHQDIASLSRWVVHEAADALWEARHELCTPPPAAIWRPPAPIFLLGSDAGTATTPPPPRDGDLWVDAVAVPSASSAEMAVTALTAARVRFTRLRESRHVGSFAILAVVVIRGDDDLRTIDRLFADLGEPAARERFGELAGPWGLIGDVLGWTV